MIYVDSPHGPGVVGILTGDLARWPQFQASGFRLQFPHGSAFTQIRGNRIACNRNVIVRNLPPEAQWVWFLDDDHTFEPDVLLRLLDRQVDIIQPLVCTRKPPYLPYAYYAKPEGGYRSVPWEDFYSDKPMQEVDAVGTGGMLVRREVLEAVGEPWFEEGKLAADALGEDLWFCNKAKRLGFRIWVDLEARLGHCGTYEVWPIRLEGQWQIGLNLYGGAALRLPHDFGVGSVKDA